MAIIPRCSLVSGHGNWTDGTVCLSFYSSPLLLLNKSISTVKLELFARNSRSGAERKKQP